MRPFEYVRARSIDDALAWLGRPGVKLLAGGTTLVDLMKLGVEAPATVVDISDLPLRSVSVVDGRMLRIGSLASNSDVAAHADVLRHVPVVAQALLSGASGQIRHAATIGGNLLQRTRCSYFRGSDWHCNKRVPGAGCSAFDGLNAGHAVLGTSEACIAVNPSDLAVALLAADASVGLLGPRGERRLPIDAFHVPPGESPDVETVMAPDELITHVDIPLPATPAASCYLKLRGRASYEFASASAAVCRSRGEGGEPATLAVALGGLGTVPWRRRPAERHLSGERVSRAAIDAFCDELLAGARTTPANVHKLSLARGAVVRCIEQVLAC